MLSLFLSNIPPQVEYTPADYTPTGYTPTDATPGSGGLRSQSANLPGFREPPPSQDTPQR